MSYPLDFMNPFFLLLQETVLQELVNQGEHHGVGHCLDLEARTGGQAQEDTGGQDIKQNRGRQQVHPHFTYHHGKFL